MFFVYFFMCLFFKRFAFAFSSFFGLWFSKYRFRFCSRNFSSASIAGFTFASKSSRAFSKFLNLNYFSNSSFTILYLSGSRCLLSMRTISSFFVIRCAKSRWSRILSKELIQASSILNRTSTAVSTLFTCCPPGPFAAENFFHRTVSRGIVINERNGILFMTTVLISWFINKIITYFNKSERWGEFKADLDRQWGSFSDVENILKRFRDQLASFRRFRECDAYDNAETVLCCMLLSTYCTCTACLLFKKYRLKITESTTHRSAE